MNGQKLGVALHVVVGLLLGVGFWTLWVGTQVQLVSLPGWALEMIVIPTVVAAVIATVIHRLLPRLKLVGWTFLVGTFATPVVFVAIMGSSWTA